MKQWFGSVSSQRELMWDLFQTLGDDQGAVCSAYVEAERKKKVERPRGAEDMSPSTRASALWWEGKLRGWLRR